MNRSSEKIMRKSTFTCLGITDNLTSEYFSDSVSAFTHRVSNFLIFQKGPILGIHFILTV